MSEANAMPFFTDAYLADTMHLSLEEHGAYMKLLMIMWRAGGWIDNDDKKISLMLGVTVARWKKIKSSISPMLLFNSDKISQKKLLKVYQTVSEKISKNKENGSKGGKAKSLKNNETDLANATNSLEKNPSECLANQNQNQIIEDSLRSSSSPLPPKKEKTQTAFPDWLPLQDWNDFLDMRKSMKKPPTERAKALLIAKLDTLRNKGHPPEKVLQQSIVKGWQDVFELKEENHGTYQRNQSGSNPTKSAKPTAFSGFDDMDYEASAREFNGS